MSALWNPSDQHHSTMIMVGSSGVISMFPYVKHVCMFLSRLRECYCCDVLAYLWEVCRTLPHPQHEDSCVPPMHFLDTAPAWAHCLCNAPRPATHGLNPCQNAPGPRPSLHHYKEMTRHKRAEGLVCNNIDEMKNRCTNLGCARILSLFYLEIVSN